MDIKEYIKYYINKFGGVNTRSIYFRVGVYGFSVCFGVFIGLLVISLFNFATGYEFMDLFVVSPVLVKGSSMIPAIPSGCTIMLSDPYTGDETITEGEVVVYQNGDKKFSHRVKYKTNNFDPESGKYTVDDFSGENILVYPREGQTEIEDLEHHNDKEIKSMAGETVYIVKGDNNFGVDGYLVQNKDIISTIIMKPQITFDIGTGFCYPEK